MKILVMCPGSFTHGLNSPERGEGRWAQNYARMLAIAGHEVYAASGGLKVPYTEEGVRLLNQEFCGIAEPYDLYIDAAWWHKKVPKAHAKKSIALKWSLENYLREEPFEENFYLAYPYPSHHHFFSRFPNAHKTFALPAMFGKEFPEPNWKQPKIFLPGKIDKNRDYQPYMTALLSILQSYAIEGTSKSFFKKEFGDEIDYNRTDSNWWENKPYNLVMDSIRQCRLSLPILNPGCIIEAAFCGVPSIFWEHGGFYNTLGQQLDISISHGAPPERFFDVVNKLMNDKKKHTEATLGIQEFFSPHLYREAIKYFNLMIETIF